MVVEVGPGLGSLTDGLMEWAPELVLIELDRDFAEHWRVRAAAAPVGKMRVTEADALALDWSTLNLVSGTLLVSNLPYQISSSLVIERSVWPCGVARMILMFQKEVAQRLVARSRTAEYGLLTAIAQTFWDVRTVLEAGPRDFHPPPRVASRVIEFRARPTGPDTGFDRAKYLTFVKAAFSHRRKLMANNLSQWQGIDLRMREQGLDPGRTRAEELTPDAFVALFLAVTGAGSR